LVDVSEKLLFWNCGDNKLFLTEAGSKKLNWEFGAPIEFERAETFAVVVSCSYIFDKS
jgi:hypothetical protein